MSRILGLALIFGLALGFVDRSDSAVAGIPPATLQDPGAPEPIFLPMSLQGLALDQLPSPAPAASATPTMALPTATTPPSSPSPTEAPPPSATPTPLPSPTAKPGYSEPLTDFPPLEDLRAGYRSDRWYPTLLEVLHRRYRHGRYVVTKLDDSENKAWRWVEGRTASFDELLDAVNLTVHEMNHQLDWQEGVVATRLQSHAYVVREDLTLLVPLVETYPRKEIAVYLVGPLSNHYRSVYLELSGDKDFQSLVDELNAYTQSLFVDYGLHDQFPPRQRRSARDGLVTMMLYTQLYLRHGREHHPADYAALQAKPEMRAAIRLLWDRAMFILEVTEAIDALSIDAAPIEAEVRKPAMLDEIERFVAPPAAPAARAPAGVRGRAE